MPRIHWPTLRWAVSNFVGDIVAYQVTPNSRVVYDAVHACVDEALQRLAAQAPDAPLIVVAHSLGSVIAADHFYDLHKGRRSAGPPRWNAARPSPRSTHWAARSRCGWSGSATSAGRCRFPGKTSDDPVIAAAAEWINFYDADDVLAFPLKGLSADYDEAVDEDRSVSVGAMLLGMSPVSHVAYWNDKSVLRPIANSLAWLWNARRDPDVRAAGRADRRP